jgi:hypothetical protein
MSRANWATYDYVRAGIEAKNRLARVKEERVQLKLHSRRMTHWVFRQTTVLLSGVRNLQVPDRIVSSKIIHRLRIARSLLELKGDDILCREDRASLLNLEARIIEAIDPFNIAITLPTPALNAPEGDNPNAPEGDNPNAPEDGVAESEYDENDVVEMHLLHEDDDGLEEAVARIERQEAAADALAAFFTEDAANEEKLREDPGEELVDRYIAQRILEDVDEELGLYDEDGDEDGDGMDLDL